METSSKTTVSFIRVKVIPRAAQTEHAGEMADGTLKIRVKAVPEHGRANEELTRFLAKEYGVDLSAIHLVSGATSQRKLFKITHDFR